MIDRIESFFRRCRRRLSRSEWAIRLLRLPVSEGTANEPGLVLIQIDGLSRRQMERALERGRLPFLRKLIQREHYETRTFYSGVPSSTPAVQGELHYGVRCAVPAFSFMDRASRRVLTMFNPTFAKSIEDQLCKNDDALLQGGSSWSNIFTGGAAPEESHFCSASMGFVDLCRSQPVMRLLTLPVLHFPSLMRLAGLLAIEFWLAGWDMLHGVFRGESFWKEFKFIFSRVLVCIGLRELVTIGAKIDVARGLRAVHLNFVGYDEQAHRRGPPSAFAHWSLKGIDRAIKNIYRAAQRSARRDYQVWVFSDHGQEATRYFGAADGVDLEQVVRDALNGKAPSAGPTDGKGRRTSHAQWAARGRGRRWMAEWSRTDPEAEAEDEAFVIAALGPVGHVYLSHPRSPDEKRKIAHKLVHESRVPGVLLKRESGKAEWVTARGTYVLPDDELPFLPHPDAMKTELARDLAALCGQHLAGDLILLGWGPDTPAVSFAEERGAHAGPGPEEVQGFVLLPPLTRLPKMSREFLRPSDLRAAALHFLERQLMPVSAFARRRTVTQRLRIMTYNVHSCRGMDGRTLPRRIARVIEQSDPDIVALQELDFGRVRSQRHDQPRLIAEALGMNVCFCPTVIDNDEQYGHALLSHFPMKIVRTEILCPTRQTRHVEPRGALWVRVDADGVLMNVMNTHFGLNRRERKEQAADLLGENWIGCLAENDPLIVCGDFNMVPRSEPYRALSRRLRDVQSSLDEFLPLNTFTTFHPFARIDHIFVSHHFVPTRIWVPRNYLTRVASDHLPLVVDLTYERSKDG